jgi:hypothetical protein
VRMRLLGWGLIAFGLAGLVLAAAGALVGLDGAARIERLADAADDTLAAATRSTQVAADAFTNVDSSLAQSKASADAAATLALDASGTLAALARAMTLSVFGTQPLLPLAAEFDTSSRQALALATTLGGVGESLSQTRTDVASIGVQLDALSAELASLRGATRVNAADDAAPPVRPLVLLAVAWLALPAIAGILGGLALLRLGDTPPIVP